MGWEHAQIWQSDALTFEAYDDSLDFNDRNLNANDNYASGLVVLKKCLQERGEKLR